MLRRSYERFLRKSTMPLFFNPRSPYNSHQLTLSDLSTKSSAALIKQFKETAQPKPTEQDLDAFQGFLNHLLRAKPLFVTYVEKIKKDPSMFSTQSEDKISNELFMQQLFPAFQEEKYDEKIVEIKQLLETKYGVDENNRARSTEDCPILDDQNALSGYTLVNSACASSMNHPPRGPSLSYSRDDDWDSD